MTDAELIHFGIPGMKWGKRLNQKRLGMAIRKQTKDAADARKHGYEDVARGLEGNVKGYRAKLKKSKATPPISSKTISKAILQAIGATKMVDLKAAQYKDNKKANSNFQARLARLKKQGKKNDIDAVVKEAKKYDTDRAAIKAKYK